MALNKNPLWVSKCEHIKKLGGFEQMGFLVKADRIGHFLGFARETPM